MKKNTLLQGSIVTFILSLLFFTPGQTVLAEEGAGVSPAEKNGSIKTIVTEDGTSFDVLFANGPIVPPEGYMSVSSLQRSSVQKTGDVRLEDVPAFSWSYGSSATAGAMVAGYYDRVGFTDMYTGSTDGGCMPLTNAGWGASDKGGHECPLSATRKGVDGRTTFGHVDDYFVANESAGPDPYVGNWTEHTSGDCTGDFMKTSKWFPGTEALTGIPETINKDGAAWFFLDGGGDPVTAEAMEGDFRSQYDAGYGLKLFFESRGYTVLTMYNQYIYPKKIYGFTFAQYKDEIDAGRPVILHVASQIVVGTGYNVTDETVLFHDSWDHDEHSMVWGGTYLVPEYEHTSVTVIHLEGTIDHAACCTDCGTNLPVDLFPWPMFVPATTGAGIR